MNLYGCWAESAGPAEFRREFVDLGLGGRLAWNYGEFREFHNMRRLEEIKRVAKAICKSRTCEGVSCCQWPAQGGRVNCPVDRGAYDDAARDAIAAMQKPWP